MAQFKNGRYQNTENGGYRGAGGCAHVPLKQEKVKLRTGVTEDQESRVGGRWHFQDGGTGAGEHSHF